MADASPPPPVVLLDRFVLITDEILGIIRETGGQDPGEALESVINGLPEGRTTQEKDAAVAAEILRYRAEVEEPAFAILRERKASRPSAVRKEPVTFTCDDAAFYRELLDGIEVHLPQLADAPSVSELDLRLSWRPDHYLWADPSVAYISSDDDHLLALYVGTYRPGLPCPGFYLVFNSWANSVAIIPPLRTTIVSFSSHCGLGAGVAVLCHDVYSGYVVAELLLRKDEDGSHRVSNKATLFMWWSPGSGPFADQWIQKEVVLPLPPEQEGAATPIYRFRADMVLAVAKTSLCWVDLLTGILVCDVCTPDDDRFHFIPLPEGCVVNLDPLSRRRHGRGQPEGYRSMCCIDGEAFKFVSIDDRQGCPMLTTWTLRRPLTRNWRWDKDTEPIFVGGPWKGLVFKDDQQLSTPSFPIISRRQPDTVYLSVADYVLRLDMGCGKLVAAFDLSSSGNRASLRPAIFATQCNLFLDKTREWDILQQARQELSMGRKELVDARWTVCKDRPDSFRIPLIPTPFTRIAVASPDGSEMESALDKEVADEGDSKSSPVMRRRFFYPDGLGGCRVMPTPNTALHGASSKKGPATSSFSPVGLLWALPYPEHQA